MKTTTMTVMTTMRTTRRRRTTTVKVDLETHGMSLLPTNLLPRQKAQMTMTGMRAETWLRFQKLETQIVRPVKKSYSLLKNERRKSAFKISLHREKKSALNANAKLQTKRVSVKRRKKQLRRRSRMRKKNYFASLKIKNKKLI